MQHDWGFGLTQFNLDLFFFLTWTSFCGRRLFQDQVVSCWLHDARSHHVPLSVCRWLAASTFSWEILYLMWMWSSLAQVGFTRPADHLHKVGVSFVVLEAQSHTGGRSHVFMLGPASVGQYVFEQGSNWACGFGT